MSDIGERLEHTAVWREGLALKFPNDRRNEFAASLCRSLAEEEPSTAALKLHDEAEAAYLADDSVEDASPAVERESELFRSIGFGFDPDSIDEIFTAMAEVYRDAMAKNSAPANPREDPTFSITA